MFTHKSTDVWEDLALIMWAAGLAGEAGLERSHRNAGTRRALRQLCSVHLQHGATQTHQQQDGLRRLHHPAGQQAGQGGHNPHAGEPDRRQDSARCGYTDTDYLLAAQAAAAEVVTGYASIDGVDLDAELRTPNAQRGRSALRTLMENAKRTATDFLVPPAMDRAIRKAERRRSATRSGASSAPRKSSCSKGWKARRKACSRSVPFRISGVPTAWPITRSLMGPTRANDTREPSCPRNCPGRRRSASRTCPHPSAGLWVHSPPGISTTRSSYWPEARRSTGRSSIWWTPLTSGIRARPASRRSSRYLQEITAELDHWAEYQDHLATLAIGVENAPGLTYHAAPLQLPPRQSVPGVSSAAP